MAEILMLYAARHGETELNAANAFRGKSNVPLDQNGIEQAHELAEYFAPIKIAGIVSSSKKRAATTAGIVGDLKGTKPVYTDSLHPWDVGVFSGQPKNKQNRDALEQYIQNPDVSIPNGESLNDFKGRVRPCILEAIEISNNAGVPLLLLGHSSIIHEIGDLINGAHHSTLVEPGGLVGVYASNGRLSARPILKGKVADPTSRSDTIS